MPNALKFQSHLRLIHPIHLKALGVPSRALLSFNRICASSTLSTCPIPDLPPFLQCFNRICASSTLSTVRYLVRLRCFWVGFNRICASSTLSTNTAMSFFKGAVKSFNRICASSTLSTNPKSIDTRLPRMVSIASAPHPPYPPDRCGIAWLQIKSFNRICASSTLSTEREGYYLPIYGLFQSHLRLIHPIHMINILLD